MSSEEQIGPHPYNEDYPLTVHLIGGWGGNAFELTGKDNGAVLEKIGVWVGGWQVTAVRAWLSDGRDRTFGEPTGPYKEYTFQPGENFTSLSLWGNGEGTRLGAIKFRTTTGGEFFHCMTEWPLVQEYVIDIGSGLCLGIKGRSGSDIDQMGFVFLNKVESALLTDVEYPTLSSLIPSVQVEEIQSVSYENDSSVEQTHTVETSKKITTTSSWSLSVGVTLTISAQVQAGIPGLLDVSGGYSFTVSTTTTQQETISEERTETVTTPIVAPPRTKVDVNITIGRAVIDLPYTGRMEITCKNGSVLQYCVKGVYKGVAYTKIKVDTKESPL